MHAPDCEEAERSSEEERTLGVDVRSAQDIAAKIIVLKNILPRKRSLDCYGGGHQECRHQNHKQHLGINYKNFLFSTEIIDCD